MSISVILASFSLFLALCGIALAVTGFIKLAQSANQDDKDKKSDKKSE